MHIASSARSIAVGLAKRALATANIEPALVKAAIRRPADVHGGPRTRRWPWPRRRHIDARERDAVLRLFDREIRGGGAIVYGGPEQKAYCQAFVDYLGGDGHAHAVNSGTNAVYVALRALDLAPGSEVIVPPITDAGGTMPVALINCIPVPADAEPGSLNTSAGQIGKVLTGRTAAIVVAHIAGHPVDMDPILELAIARGIPVVEDCAQALGAVYKGRMCGTLGTIGAFSSMFGKQHCTGGQGGVLFTKSTLLFARIRQIADRGKPHGAVGVNGNVIASLNFNQDEISMAIGRVQLAKLPAAIEARRSFAARVFEGLEGVAGVTQVGTREACLNSPWFLMLRLDAAQLACNAAEFAVALEREGIGGTQAGYPFYPTDQHWYRERIVYGASGMPWSLAGDDGASAVPRHVDLPNAHEANAAIVRVDVHESLGVREARDLVAAVRKLARWFARVPVHDASRESSAATSASSPAPHSAPTPAPASRVAASPLSIAGPREAR